MTERFEGPGQHPPPSDETKANGVDRDALLTALTQRSASADHRIDDGYRGGVVNQSWRGPEAVRPMFLPPKASRPTTRKRHGPSRSERETFLGNVN
jgi:hypothetical protein